MKAEHTETPPVFNLLKPDGVRSQGHTRDVTHVLLNNGGVYRIEPETFKFYKVASANGVPYITFVVCQDGTPLAGKRLEVFPASITGIAYNNEADSEHDSGS